MQPQLTIGAVARQAGLSVPTVRYYEEIGLLPPAPRTEGGQRHYGPSALRRLTFVRRCRDFGFSLDDIRELVGLVDQPERPCLDVRDIAARHLESVRSKVSELQALERSLTGFVASCNSACAGGAVVDCTILEDLTEPLGDTPTGVPPAPRCCG